MMIISGKDDVYRVHEVLLDVRNFGVRIRTQSFGFRVKVAFALPGEWATTFE